MPPPGDYVDITSYPFSTTVTQAAFNVANERWFRIVLTEDSVVGWYITAGGTFKPDYVLYESDGETVIYSQTLLTQSYAYRRALTTGTYYLKVTRHGGGASDFDFPFIANKALWGGFDIPVGALIINDDGTTLPAAVYEMDGTLLGFHTTIPAGEMAAHLPTGESLWNDRFGVLSDAGTMALFDASVEYVLSTTQIFLETAFQPPSIAASETAFYVLMPVDPDDIGVYNTVYQITSEGVVTLVATLPIATAITIGVSYDGATLYYTDAFEYISSLGVSDPVIHRWDLLTDTALPDFYTVTPLATNEGGLAITANRWPGEILGMPDGSVVTYYRNEDSDNGWLNPHDTLLHIDSDGTLLNSYEYANDERQIDHISWAQAGGSATINIWWYIAPFNNLANGRIVTLTLADGSEAEGFETDLFTGPRNMVVNSDTVLGPSTSCAMVTMLAIEEEPEPEPEPEEPPTTECIEDEDDNPARCDCPEYTPKPGDAGNANPHAPLIRWSDHWSHAEADNDVSNPAGGEANAWLIENYHGVYNVEFDTAPDPLGDERLMLVPASSDPASGLTRGIGTQTLGIPNTTVEPPNQTNPRYGDYHGQFGAVGMVIWPTDPYNEHNTILFEIWGNPRLGTDGDGGTGEDPGTVTTVRRPLYRENAGEVNDSNGVPSYFEEWLASFPLEPGNEHFDVDSTTSPHSGTKCIRGEGLGIGELVRGNFGALGPPEIAVPRGYILSDFGNLVFWIKNETVTWPADVWLEINFLVGPPTLLAVGGVVTLAHGDYGFDQSNVTDWQQIAIPITEFGAATGDNADYILIRKEGTTAITISLDDISLVAGGEGGGGEAGVASPGALIALHAWADPEDPDLAQNLALYVAGAVGARNVGRLRARPITLYETAPETVLEEGSEEVVAGVASDVTATTATLNGTATPAGVETFGYFRWGPQIESSGYALAYATTPQNLGSGVDPVDFSAPITGLTPETLYYFQSVTWDGATEILGEIHSFVTSRAGAGDVLPGASTGYWVTDQMYGVVVPDDWHKIEMKWQISTFVSSGEEDAPGDTRTAKDGWVRVYVDEVEVIHIREIHFLLGAMPPETDEAASDSDTIPFKNYWEGAAFRPMGWLACLYLSEKPLCRDAIPDDALTGDGDCGQNVTQIDGNLGAVPAILVDYTPNPELVLTRVSGIDTPTQDNSTAPEATGYGYPGVGGNIPPNTSTWYRVTAVLDGQESSWSSLIECENAYQHFDRIEWTPPPQGADSYRIYQLLSFDLSLHQSDGGVLKEETYYVKTVPGTQTPGGRIPSPTAEHWVEFSSRPEGAPHIAANYQVDAESIKTTWVIAGHAVSEILDVYAMLPPDRVTGEISDSGDPLPASFAGGDVLTRLREGTDYTVSFVEKPSGRFTVIEVFVRLQDLDTCMVNQITVNLCGIETNADGTGEVIEQGALIFEHFLLNWVFNHYETGSWFTDVANAPGLVAHDSYVEAAEYAQSLTNEVGYLGAVWIGEFAEVRQLILEALTSYNLMFFYRNMIEDSFGGWAVAMFDTRWFQAAEDTSPLFDQFEDILADTFSTAIDIELTANVIAYNAGPYNTGNGGWVIAGRQTDDGSVAKTWGRIERELQLRWTRHSPTASDIVASQLNLRSYPYVIGEFQTMGRGILIEPGSRIRIAHEDAPGLGWTVRVALVIGNDLDLDTGIVTLRFITTPSMV
ncbi:MAG TPA: hypothetical protein VFP27_12045 [Mycobacterium sp.]|nr:hypothetical protein [Mycobacterium sp.]